MEKNFDTVIIGSGCGGSASAALMSYLGHKTLLIEKNKIIGGRTAVFEKDGFKLDHGHVLTRCDKGPHGEVLRLVGCRDLIPKFSYAKNWPIQAYLGDRCVDLYPTPKLAILKGKGLKIARELDLTLAECIGAARMGARFATMTDKQIKKYDTVDFQSFKSRYTINPYLNAFLEGFSVGIFGQPAWEASSGEVIRIARNTLRDFYHVGYPISGEGVSAVPKSFIKAARRMGADIMTGAAVENIIIENGAAKGVTVGGERILADRVISNAGIMPTVTKLAGREHFERGYVRRIENLKYSCSGFSFKYALKKKITDYVWGGQIPLNVVQSYNDMISGSKTPEKFILMFFASSNLDPSLAPQGCQTISCISGGPVMEPGQFDWEPWMREARKQVERLLPGIEENTLFCMEQNPDQIAKFNGRFYGDAVGAAQTIDQMGDRRPSFVSPVKNLYHVGADVGWGSMATEAATLSAIYLYNHLEERRA